MVKNIIVYILLIFTVSGCSDMSTEKNKIDFQITLAKQHRSIDSYDCPLFVRKKGELVGVNGHTCSEDVLNSIFNKGEVIQKDSNRLDLYIQIDEEDLVTASDLLTALRLLAKCAKNSKKPWRNVTIFLDDPVFWESFYSTPTSKGRNN
jgi:hypothetical protein